jgi:hypothetical protein
VRPAVFIREFELVLAKMVVARLQDAKRDGTGEREARVAHAKACCIPQASVAPAAASSCDAAICDAAIDLSRLSE